MQKRNCSRLMSFFRRAALVLLVLAVAVARGGTPPEIDDSPARAGEWGFRPADGATLETNPPAFVWRPQKDAATYVLECSPASDFSRDVYRGEKMWLNVHCPPKSFPTGKYFWRFAFVDRDGKRSQWSTVRTFTIPQSAVEFPMPPISELLDRVPKQHPRLFVRPEEIAELRRQIRGPLREQWQELVREADRLLSNPPSLDEPLKYDPTMKRGEPRWLERWWGNRVKVISVVDGAATLAFVHMLTGEQKYGDAARRFMLAAASWDPAGATARPYNDEAAMPVLYMLSRAYTWGQGVLSEADRQKIRASMEARGKETFDFLMRMPHTWRPYNSHNNRMWHKLGELSVAFLGEIPDTDKWLEFALNVFYCCYPVWSDDDGGWHEGTAYWSSYQGRHTYWLDVMKSAMGIDGYRKPFFHRAGYFPIYAMPPGIECGGFGDQASEFQPRSLGGTIAILARGSQNGHWQWYADQIGATIGSGYPGVLRERRPAPQPKPPTDLPQSRLFRGTGLAMLHTDLLNAKNDIQVFFKSSPMGQQSHGFNSQNSFILAVHGKPVLIWTGRRDWHGSKHHTQWMWETKSQNCILVNGNGQIKHSPEIGGKITAFHTSGEFDYVVGDASKAYGEALSEFTRTILFAKPDVILIYDRLAAPKPATFTWLMHAQEQMEAADQTTITASNGDSHALVSILEPRGLRLSQNDRFDPQPQDRPTWRQWHLSAETPESKADVQFVTVVRPYAGNSRPTGNQQAKKVSGGWLCNIGTSDGGKLFVLLAAGPAGQEVEAAGVMKTSGQCAAVRLDRAGKVLATFSGGGRASYQGGPKPLVIERKDGPISP